MSNEIKVKFAVVEKVLINAQAASQHINTSFPAPGKGRNQLASLDSCEAVMKELSDEIRNYTEVVHDHISKTQQLIESLRQEDEKIASGIRKGAVI